MLEKLTYLSSSKLILKSASKILYAVHLLMYFCY